MLATYYRHTQVGWLVGFYLAVDEGGNGEVPCCIGGHAETQKRPHSVIVERRNEHCGCAARSENVRPGSLVQPIVDVVYVAGTADQLNDRSEEEEGAVEGEADGFPVRPQQPIQHLKPLQFF